jgi:hypothetical protein
MTGPVTVVDDAYVDHMLNIGPVQTLEIGTGRVVSSERLYEGEEPTGPELRRLLEEPVILDTLTLGVIAEAQVRTIRGLSLTELVAR